MRPEFVDNLDGNTLAEALRGHLEWLLDNRAPPIELAVATGYFNPEGFALIADQLEKLDRVRLLLGAEPIPPPARPRRKPGQPRGAAFEALFVDEALRKFELGLRSDRDLLGFAPEVDRCVKRLLSLLESGRIEVRRYEKAFLHGKAFIFAGDEGVIAGSSNFTAAGLTSNLELNLGRYDPTPVEKVKLWFDRLWEEASPYDLAAVYEARFQEYEPYLIYLRVLWELYGSELEEERELDPNGRIRLTTFQNDGIFRAQRILAKYNGVLVADGVGLGKSFIGGKLISEAVEERRQRALLIAPAALRDGPWKRFADIHQLYLECISYEQLAEEKMLGGAGGSYLKEKPDQYAMVIVDEAQAFRNPATRRAEALRRLLRGTPPKQLVLLSATPVNNTLWDLYYLLQYFVQHDAVFSHRGVVSLVERFREATDEDPYDLRPDKLFDVIDEVTVRRTRHFVKRYYPDDRIIGPGGIEIAVTFPRPHVEKAEYRLDELLPGFFDEFEAALMPEDTEPELSMARYAPSLYLKEGRPDMTEVALVGLLRSSLLKRFESSAYAFCLTAERMAKGCEVFLRALEIGLVPKPENVGELVETDSDESFEKLLTEGSPDPISLYKEDELLRDVKRDRDLLRRLGERASVVTLDNDPKLAELSEVLARIVEQAKEEGTSETDIRDKQKVIVFSFYEATLDWIEEYVTAAVDRDPRLACYRGRIASVGGSESRGGVSREKAVFGFAPRSSEAPAGRDDDLYDILLTTDVLAEGVNLQQCRNLINFDLPWNPMRLVQRHGRIDRIGSPHRDVFVWCYFPDDRLEDLLEIERRIREKLARAAASIGVESEVIPGATTSELVFTETREEIERLRNEDPTLLENAGEDPYAHSGEEYRQELRKGLESYGNTIRDLPWAVGSGFAYGRETGHFFCARVGDRTFLRFVPFDGGEVVSNTLECLRLIGCKPDTPRALSEPILQRVYSAWEMARESIYREWSMLTDPANLQPKVPRALREAVEHLRKYPPAELTQVRLDEVLSALEAPHPERINRLFRTILDSGELSQAEKSKRIVGTVEELGLQPYVAPDPWPPIEPSEVQLVCWMAVSV